jgi:hypothetical protein
MSEETMTPQEGSGAITVNEAATAFEGFLSPAEDSQEQPETDEVETVEAEADESEETEEVESEEIESEDNTEEVEYEASEDDDEAEEIEEPQQTYKVKAAGEEKEVTLEELMQGYQLGADYTKKTQEVAELRKANEAERLAIQQAAELRDDYARRLQTLQQYMADAETGISSAELADLKENDPVGYAVKVAEITERKEQLTKLKAEQDRIAKEQQAEYVRNMNAYIAEEAKKLSQHLPEFSDMKKGEQIKNEIRSYLKSFGYTDQDLSKVVDHRQILIAIKAKRYDDMQKSKPNVKKKVAQAHKMVKSGTKVKAGNRDITKQQMDRLRQSGRKEDAAALFENFI